MVSGEGCVCGKNPEPGKTWMGAVRCMLVLARDNYLLHNVVVVTGMSKAMAVIRLGVVDKTSLFEMLFHNVFMHSRMDGVTMDDDCGVSHTSNCNACLKKH
jgi:hypothetical protein